jgi:hypothetical protein
LQCDRLIHVLNMAVRQVARLESVSADKLCDLDSRTDRIKCEVAEEIRWLIIVQKAVILCRSDGEESQKRKDSSKLEPE